MARPASIGTSIVYAVAVLALLAYRTCAASAEDDPAINDIWVVTQGHLTLDFDPVVLNALRWQFAVHEPEWAHDVSSESTTVRFPVNSTSTLRVIVRDGDPVVSFSGRMTTRGAMMIDNAGERAVLGHFTLEPTAHGDWRLVSTLGRPIHHGLSFDIERTVVELTNDPDALRLTGDLVMTADTAIVLGLPEMAGVPLGTVGLDVQLEPALPKPTNRFSRRAGDAGHAGLPNDVLKAGADETGLAVGAGIGPDVIVGDVQSVRRWARVDGITAYSVGTTSCNIGDEWVNWFANTNQHPVIAQNMYRLKGGRFEQIGMSWVKHGFAASNDTLCSGVEVCAFDPVGAHLGVDCSDTYNSTLNGFQANLGPRVQVNPTTGFFPYPFSAPSLTSAIDRRLQVRDEDLDPDLNLGALYFAEGHYLSPDDAIAGNQNNNASYRRITIVETLDNVFNGQVVVEEQTARTKPAILAWQDRDPDVGVTLIDVPNDGRFIVAAKVSERRNGTWHYEYAIHNLNSQRSGKSFSVPIPDGVTVTNIGFHDVDSHSGSPFSSIDWLPALGNGKVAWATDTTNLNPMRWGMLYNFRFDADTPPEPGQGTLGLLFDGDPPTMTIDIPVPSEPMMLINSDPPDGAIDARQSHDLNNSSVSLGWQEIRLSFNARGIGITKEDVTMVVIPDSVRPPIVANLIPESSGVLIVLERPISPGHWTCVSVAGTIGRTCLGYLPADAGGDRLSTASDILVLVDAVTSKLASQQVPGRLLPDYAADINRSGGVNGRDIVRLIDLLNGAGSFDIWLMRDLPQLITFIP